MQAQYLDQLDIPTDRGLYLDCGVLFPFYFKDAHELNTTRWLSNICYWLNHSDIKTTSHVWREMQRAYHTVPLRKRERIGIKPLCDKVLSHIHTVTVSVRQVEEGRLSTADLSLLNRPDQDVPLLTADKALYYADANAFLLLWDKNTQCLSCVTEKVM